MLRRVDRRQGLSDHDPARESLGTQETYLRNRITAMAHISIGQSSKMCHRLGTSLKAGVDIMGVLNREADLWHVRLPRQHDPCRRKGW